MVNYIYADILSTLCMPGNLTGLLAGQHWDHANHAGILCWYSP